MSLRDWYPLALSRDITPGTSAGTRVEGHEFVVWRDAGGAAHIWEDRCPHRGMKMSFGFVRGDHIACLYHGWQYDSEGQCRHIPAHPDLDVPATIRIARFAVLEAGGIIWGCFNEVDGNLPRAPELPAATTPVRSLFIDCPAQRLTALIADIPFEGSAPNVTTRTGRIVGITLGDNVLIAAVQPVSGSESALHLIATGALESQHLKQISTWSEQLRREVEALTSKDNDGEIAA
ncbi:Rieske (2Fe-2S) protein [Roseibium marinum]|uniref:Rieske-like 2Fe-2S protein n=1 Tax=Roseibium marinum TaxID=281252 RepID=A0A2S3UT02_9HYPH|nr:Rieske (2Fe-2S) protein [Roseibium marinum]POF30841.1 Rieske-like 2Fe-2S protein [Roseibium marinum]